MLKSRRFYCQKTASLSTKNMSTKTQIFVTGATGFIGGDVLTRLLAHPSRDTFDITALVRNTDKAKLLEDLGINAVVGSLSETDKLEELASKSDVVFAMADADNLAATKAVLSGLKKKHAKTGQAPILIHTSGTAIIADDALGKYAGEEIYSDANTEQMESIDPKSPHRDVDLAVVDADKQGFVKTYIVVPSTIFGIATGPLVERGISNSHSLQVPAVIKTSWDRKQAGMVGEGKNLWPCIHINEQADLFIVLLDAALNNPGTPHGREGWYFGENGEYNYYELAKAVGKTLVELGRAQSGEPTSFTPEEIQKYFGGSGIFGSNSRCRADRGRALGWKPTKSTQDLYDSVKPEIEALVKSKVLVSAP